MCHSPKLSYWENFSRYVTPPSVTAFFFNSSRSLKRASLCLEFEGTEPIPGCLNVFGMAVKFTCGALHRACALNSQ